MSEEKFKVKLFRYQRAKGYEEEIVIASFQPSKVDGFGVVRNVNSLLHARKYTTGGNRVMIPEQKRNIFEYCGWIVKKDVIIEEDVWELLDQMHPLNANNMVSAMKKISSKKEWNDFVQFSFLRFRPDAGKDFILWLMQPEQFFELMGEWLESKVN